jgi:hypothetical protein
MLLGLIADGPGNYFHKHSIVCMIIIVLLLGIKPEDVNEVYMGNVCTASEGQAPCRQATLGAGKFIWEMCVLHQKARHHVDRLHLGQVSLYGKCVYCIRRPGTM